MSSQTAILNISKFSLKHFCNSRIYIISRFALYRSLYHEMDKFWERIRNILLENAVLFYMEDKVGLWYTSYI